MLEIRPNCENCNKPLPYNSEEALICSFECTFCKDCVQNILQNVCPNCGGGFQQRPVRPKGLLLKYPLSSNIVCRKVDSVAFEGLLTQFLRIPPNER